MSDAPTTIHRYEIVERLGQGGMGELYLARDPALERFVAIKVLRSGFDSDELRARFTREARSVARLAHINIVTIFDVGEHEGRPYIAMEYIPGETLFQKIRARSPLPLATKLQYIDELCAGLAHAHRAGIIHRDVKPANLIVGSEGTLKILDFGIARLADSSMTQAGMMIGTLNYMSPEQITGQEVVSHRSDIFAVGAVFYELLCYQQAFPGGIDSGVLNRIIVGTPPPLDDVCPGLDSSLVELVGRALAKAPADRFEDLVAMRTELIHVRDRLDGSVLASTLTGLRTRKATQTTTPAGTPRTPKRGLSREDLQRRRAEELAGHLNSARAALDAGRFEEASAACERVLIIAENHEEALEIGEQARQGIERNQIGEWMYEAREDLGRGDLSAARHVLSQILALSEDSEEAAELRAAIETAESRRRADDAVVGGRACLDRGDAPAAAVAAREALSAHPAHTAAAALLRDAELIVEELRRKAEHDRRASEAIANARRGFADADHDNAIALLSEFSPPHPDVDRALDALRIEAAEIRERKIARERQIAAELATARACLSADDLPGALAAVGRARVIAHDHADVRAMGEAIETRRGELIAKRRAEEEAQRRAAEELRRQREEEARRKAAEKARQEAAEAEQRRAREEIKQREEERRRQAAEQARRHAEEVARRKADAEAQQRVEQEARRQAAEQARQEAEQAARREAAAEAKQRADAEARRNADEQARERAEEEGRRKADDEARRAAEQSQSRWKVAQEEARRKAAERVRQRAEEEARQESEAEGEARAQAAEPSASDEKGQTADRDGLRQSATASAPTIVGLEQPPAATVVIAAGPPSPLPVPLLSRPPAPTTGAGARQVLPLAAAAVIALVVVGFSMWKLTSGDRSLEGTAPLTAAVAPEPAGTATTAPPPPAAPVETGTLLIDAAPWAEIVEIVGATGPVSATASYTPLAVAVPAGDYRITLRNPSDPEPRVVSARVEASGSARAFAEFKAIDVAEYFVVPHFRAMRRLLASAVFVCLLAAVVHGDYKDSYRKGIQARNRGRWAEVARFMREAIAEESRETGERVNISGMDFEPYLPHYYLGLALFNAGDCVGALASWQTSDAQGTVRRLPEGASLLKYRKECETKVAASGRPVPPTSPAKPVPEKPGPTPPAPTPVPGGPDPAAVSAAVQNAAAAIAKAEEAAKAVASFESDSILAPVWKTEAALGPADQNARKALDGARADLDAGRKDSNLQRLQQAAAGATSAAQLFENVRRAAGTRQDELRRIAAETAARPLRLEPPEARPVTPPTLSPNVAKPPDNVKPPPPTPAFTPPPALIGAARLFFSSRYQEASESLGRLRYSSGPAAAHTALLRAATSYSLYLVGGEKDGQLLEQARQQVLECRRLGPGLQPDPQAFSPRFIEYFATAK